MSLIPILENKIYEERADAFIKKHPDLEIAFAACDFSKASTVQEIAKTQSPAGEFIRAVIGDEPLNLRAFALSLFNAASTASQTGRTVIYKNGCLIIKPAACDSHLSPHDPRQREDVDPPGPAL